MIIFIYNRVFVILLLVETIYCQDTDCHKIIKNFKENDNNYYAKITVPFPENHNNKIKLHVQIQIANKMVLYNQYFSQNLQFLGTIDDILHNLPLVYKLEYPPWDDILPKVTSILINNQVICIAEPLKGFGIISTIDLDHTMTLNYFGNSGNINPNMSSTNNNNDFPNTIRTTKPPNIVYTNPSSPKIHANLLSPKVITPFNQNVPNPNSNNRNFNYNNHGKNRENDLNSCGKHQQTSSNLLIANGKTASLGAYPWTGALFLRKNSEIQKFLCGASLITKKLALTAGHCIRTDSNLEYYLIFGRTRVKDWLDENSQSVKVDKAMRHPDYNDETSDADLAILHFSKEVTYTATVKPVCLWETDTFSQSIINETGVVAGWGRNENDQLEESLQELYIRVISDEECLRSSREFYEFTSDRTFCAGNNTNAGPCNGDSGSGFYFFVNNRWTIRGIVSRSLKNMDERCDFSKYAVYLDVAKHIEWIRQFL